MTEVLAISFTPAGYNRAAHPLGLGCFKSSCMESLKMVEPTTLKFDLLTNQLLHTLWLFLQQLRRKLQYGSFQDPAFYPINQRGATMSFA